MYFQYLKIYILSMTGLWWLKWSVLKIIWGYCLLKKNSSQVWNLFFRRGIISNSKKRFFSSSFVRRKMDDDDKNPNTLRKFIPYKIGFNTAVQGCPKKGGGWAIKKLWDCKRLLHLHPILCQGVKLLELKDFFQYFRLFRTWFFVGFCRNLSFQFYDNLSWSTILFSFYCCFFFSMISVLKLCHN